MRALKCDGCIEAALGIMIRYGGFWAEEFPGLGRVEPGRIEAVLADLESGGYMGAKELQERHEGGMEYYRRMLLKDKSLTQYRRYMLWWKIRSGRRDMFPAYRRLKEMYPCVARCPLLAPAMWLYQAGHYPITKIRAGVLRRDIRSDDGEMDAASAQRVELFEKLGML